MFTIAALSDNEGEVLSTSCNANEVVIQSKQPQLDKNNQQNNANKTEEQQNTEMKTLSRILERKFAELQSSIEYLKNQHDTTQQQLHLIEQHLCSMQQQSLGTK